VSFFRFFFCGIHPAKKVERFPARMAIQDTDEPSSDRLIQEGRPHMRRLSYFFRFRDSAPPAKFGGIFARSSTFRWFWTRRKVLAEKAQNRHPYGLSGMVRLFLICDWIRESLDFPTGLKDQE
jgi:hypothetical protein